MQAYPQAVQQPLPGSIPGVVGSIPGVVQENNRPQYNGKTSVVLGAIQVTSGIVIMISQLIITIFLSIGAYSGAGFWCGIIYILSGAFGIAAGKSKSKCLIVTYMVLSIIGCVLSIGLLASSSAALGADRFAHGCRYGSSYYYNNYNSYDNRNYVNRNNYNYGPCGYLDVVNAFNAILLILWLVELITLIWGSALGCKVLCCSSGASSQPQAVIIMGGLPAAQNVYQPQGQPAAQNAYQPQAYPMAQGAPDAPPQYEPLNPAKQKY